ncbi:hypothetical protein V6N11_000072 [Hibiscus sabdariffa]|uniref:Cell cycle checkpoint control protein RAD9A n=1 Tax=Hibiscus sabdariffa TaxID=183260 RepID=A0ABR2NP40_9ROSI
MELSLSYNALKTFSRSITCLARVGNELVFQASSSQLALHTLNSSRSAYQSVMFKPNFFDVYRISSTQVQCSVLLKAVCSVFRTPIASIDNLTVELADPDASKIQWALTCYSEPTSLPSDAASEIGGKAVELRSYIDPTKENDSSLHTQLWIDPSEEFVQYTHTGNPVDVTFSMKELKAFLTFCEGCEVDIHLFLDKAGEPILLATKFGLDDASVSNFDAALVLATMLTSQLNEGNPSEPVQAATTIHNQAGTEAQERFRANVSEHPSDHTRIWSVLSGSAARSGNGVEERPVKILQNLNTSEQRNVQRVSMMQTTKDAPIRENIPDAPSFVNIGLQAYLHFGKCFSEWGINPNLLSVNYDRSQINVHGLSQRHPSNWVDANEEEDGDDDNELCVQSTPPYYEEQ